MLRLKTIELIAYWEGRLVTNRLIDWFGISRQQASADIRRYLERHNPSSLIHDPSVKGYVPTAGFHTVLSNGRLNEYLDLVTGFVGEALVETLELSPNLVAVQLPDRAVEPKIVRPIIQACLNHKSIRINYASMRQPNGSVRTISPHTLIYSGFRWHVRAYCHSRESFRDFSLTRIIQAPEQALKQGLTIADDLDWQEKLTLNIVPNAALSEDQQRMVEKDYAMQDGRLQIIIRKALAHYTLQRYQAAILPEEATQGKKFQIMLLETDRDKLGPYLFGSQEKV
jgi:predicted DNA-binding transcriptional regulator YafY